MKASTIVLSAAFAVAPLMATADCPRLVTDAAKKAVPDASLTKCFARKHGGFEARLEKKDKSIVEIDISAKGEIEQTEEVVPVSSVPEAVTKAVTAKYGKQTLLKAEKQTKADKTVTYEVAFKTNKGLREATFKADGTFIEEE